MTEGQQLALIRDTHAAAFPALWALAADGDGEFVEAGGEMGELLPICRIVPGASDAERRILGHGAQWIGFLLGLVDRAIFAARSAEGRKPDRASGLSARPSGGSAGAAGETAREAGKRKDYAAECAMKCAEPAFKLYLEQRHGLERPLTDDKVRQRVRSLCGVASRRELNDEGTAQVARWRSLVADFEQWRRQERA